MTGPADVSEEGRTLVDPLAEALRIISLAGLSRDGRPECLAEAAGDPHRGRALPPARGVLRAMAASVHSAREREFSGIDASSPPPTGPPPLAVAADPPRAGQREDEDMNRALAAIATVSVIALVACSATPTIAPGSNVPGATTTATSGPTSNPEGTATAGPTTPSDLLTPADVEQVSGLTGIKVVPRGSSAGAGGQVNLATADGKLVVIGSFGNGAEFDAMKSTPNYREPLSGLGDAAFVGPSMDITQTLYIVAFKKGDHTAILTTFFEGTTTTTVLSMDQLKALAAIVASRW
jgi:hypothetical protein